MAEYKIVQISQKPPKAWSFPDKQNPGRTISGETYKVMLEGIDESVDVNRKTGNKPNIGDIINGTLEATDFGFKFKPDRSQAPAAQSGSQQYGKPNEAARDMAMYTSYAKDLAVAILETSPGGEPFNTMKFEAAYKAVAKAGEFLHQHAELGIALLDDAK